MSNSHDDLLTSQIRSVFGSVIAAIPEPSDEPSLAVRPVRSPRPPRFALATGALVGFSALALVLLWLGNSPSEPNVPIANPQTTTTTTTEIEMSLSQREELRTLVTNLTALSVADIRLIDFLPMGDVLGPHASCAATALGVDSDPSIAQPAFFDRDLTLMSIEPAFATLLVQIDNGVVAAGIDLTTCSLVLSMPAPPLVSEADRQWLQKSIEDWFIRIGAEGRFLGPQSVYGEPRCVLDAAAAEMPDVDPALLGIRGIDLFQPDRSPQDLGQDSSKPEFVPTGWATAVLGLYETTEWTQVEDPSSLLTDFFVASVWVERTSKPESCFIVDISRAADHFGTGS